MQMASYDTPWQSDTKERALLEVAEFSKRASMRRAANMQVSGDIMSNTDPIHGKKSFVGYAWRTLAVLTCPCHLPLFAILLGGTAAGSFISEHRVLFALALTMLFVLFAAAAVRAFTQRS